MGPAALLALLAWGCGQTKAETVDITINSAVCEMCVNRIQAVVAAVDGVKEVKVDIESHLVHVTFYTGKTSLAAIETIITETGYDANDKPADPAAFAKLPSCCQMGKGHEEVKLEL